LAAGISAILAGVGIGTNGLIQDNQFTTQDIQVGGMFLALGAWFTLWALLGRRFRGLESDKALSWPRITGGLGLSCFGAYGAMELLGAMPGAAISAILLWMFWYPARNTS
ncbi:MAG: hypothetical protein ACRD21_19415, partial [Vicinamibacteria bacterium]